MHSEYSFLKIIDTFTPWHFQTKKHPGSGHQI